MVNPPRCVVNPSPDFQVQYQTHSEFIFQMSIKLPTTAYWKRWVQALNYLTLKSRPLRPSPQFRGIASRLMMGRFGQKGKSYVYTGN